MYNSDVELGIRKYKSLPSNLNNYGDQLENNDVNISINPLIKSMTKTNEICVDSHHKPIINLGIVGNFVECLKNTQTYLEKKQIWEKTKNKFNYYFPYVLHYYTHLIFIIVFEIIFYFKYATIIEKELIRDLITSMVSTVIEIYFQYNPQANKIVLTQEMAQAICDKYDKMANNHNDTIYENCLVGIIVLISFFCLILLIGTKLYGYKLVVGVVIDSIVLIMLLGIFEYFFFAYIILGYQIITMGEIICIAVNIAYQYMQTH